MSDWSDEAVDDAVRDWAEGRAAPAADSAAFVAAVEARRAARSRRRTFVVGLVAAGLLTALLGLVLATSQGDEPVAPVVREAPAVAETAPPQELLEGPAGHEVLWPEIRYGTPTLGSGEESTLAARDRVVADLGDDRIAVEGTVGYTAIRSSRARGVRTVLRLESGRLAAQVASRAEGGSFTVIAGEVSVRVLGTRFSVERGDAETIVTVEEGTVSVRVGGPTGPEDVTVAAGQRLRWPTDGAPGLDSDPRSPRVSDRRPRPARGVPAARRVEDHTSTELLALLTPAPLPTPPAPPEPEPEPEPRVVPPPQPALPNLLAGYRAQMIVGEVAEARAALEALAVDHPDDVAVLSLLSFAQRKDGAPLAAAETLLRAAAVDPAQEGRFVYDAASLFDAADQPGRVVDLLAPRVSRQTIPGALLPDARLRLGRAQLATGAEDAGRATLEELTRAHPGTSAAASALALLNEGEDSL